MKAQRYMLSECWKMFETDNKGLQRWLERAKIQPNTSEADHRTKYLTYEQLQQLAAFLDRELPEVLPPPKESTGPYKLLLDQVKEYQGQQLQLQQELANNRSLHNQELGKVLLTLEGVQKEVDNAFSQAHEAWLTIDHAREQHEEELSTLRVSFEGKIEEVRQLYEAQRQQHESLAELIKANQQEMEHSQRELASRVTSLDELFQSRLQGFVETLSGRDDELQALHQRAQKEISGQLQDVWGTMKKAQDTLAEQQRSLEQFHTQLAAREPELSQLTHQVDSQAKLQASLQQAFQEFQDQQKEGEERTLALTRELETLERDQARDLSLLTRQLEATEISYKALEGTLHQETTHRSALEQQLIVQERLLSTLQRELQEERDAREALAHQVSTLATLQAPPKKVSSKRPRKGREPQMEGHS